MRTFVGLLLVLAGLATAQFQFFEQFFQGGQQAQGQQEKQNVPSDSSWYRQNWEGGQYIHPFVRDCCDEISDSSMVIWSPLLRIASIADDVY